MSLITTVVVVVVVLHAAAHAQTASVDTTVMIGRDDRDVRLPAEVTGAAAGISLRVGQRWTLGLDADWPRTRSYDLHSDTTTVVGTRSLGDSHHTFQGPIIALTSGWQFAPRPRLTVTPTIGFGLERRYFTNSGTADMFDAQGGLLKHDVFAVSSTFVWPSAPLGVDVAYALSSHVAVTSQWRLYVDPFFFLDDGCCDGLQTQVRLGVRWRF